MVGMLCRDIVWTVGSPSSSFFVVLVVSLWAVLVCQIVGKRGKGVRFRYSIVFEVDEIQLLS